MATTRKAPIRLTQPLVNSISESYISRLDPKYVEYYNTYKAGRLAAHQIPIEEYRANPAKYTINVGRAVGPDVHAVSQPKVPVGDGATIDVRVYEPAPTSSPRPVLVWYHGGGWVLGNLEMDDDFLRQVVDRTGCVAFNVDYRLAPEFRCPVPVEDSIAAFEWVLAHHKDYNLDMNRVAVGGISAGGNISAIIAHHCRQVHKTPLALQVLAVPCVDLDIVTPEGEIKEDCPYASQNELWDVPELSRERMLYFVKHYFKIPRAPETYNNWKISPMKADTFAGLAPALILTAEFDVLRDEAEAYGQKMNEAGSRATVVRIPRVTHTFMMLDDILDGAKQFNETVFEALKAAFAAK